MFARLAGFAAPFLFLLCCLAEPAAAQVRVAFHSFNGSMMGGRYPHTFVRLYGTLDADGRAIEENYGYTAVSASPAVLMGNVAGTIMIEKPKYLASTNVHFTVPVSDAQYHAIVAEMRAWRDAPGKTYSLDRHNCVHFVARIAEIVGLRAEVPANLVRKPKAWLNHVIRLNPTLGAREIR